LERFIDEWIYDRVDVFEYVHGMVRLCGDAAADRFVVGAASCASFFFAATVAVFACEVAFGGGHFGESAVADRANCH
jgi:hypothetical protein